MGKTLNLTDFEASVVEREMQAVVEAPGTDEPDDYDRAAQSVLKKIDHTHPGR